MLLKKLFFCLSAVLLMGLASGEARADEITISGSTTGVVSGVPQLTFTGNANFNGMTSLGIGSLSGPNSLGSFFLSTAPQQLLGGSFTLNITFTLPAGINGGQGTTTSATITGSVSPNINQGGVNVDFNNTPVLFTFNDGTNTGFFTLTLVDVFVQSGQSANLTAGITGSQSAVPEPATLLLLGTGLAGVAAKFRRRGKAEGREQT